MKDAVYIDAAIKRFWGKVDIRGSDECWPWSAYCNENGYGQFCFEGKTIPANRFVMMLKEQDFQCDRFKLACHTCDNPPCCNPSHIFAGTPKKNMDDRDRRGRNFEKSKTHCIRGHPFDGTNTKTRIGRSGGIERICRACIVFHNSQLTLRRRAAR